MLLFPIELLLLACVVVAAQEMVIIPENFTKQMTTEAIIPLLQFKALGKHYALQLERWNSLYTNNYQSMLLRHQNNGTYKLAQSKRKPICVFRAHDVNNVNVVGTASFCNQKFQLTILDRTNASNTFSIVPQEDSKMMMAQQHVAFRHRDITSQPRYGCETSTSSQFAQRIVAVAASAKQRRRHPFPFGKRTKTVQVFVVNDVARTAGFPSSVETEQDTAVIMGIVNTLYEAFPIAPYFYRVQFKLSGQLSVSGSLDAWLVSTSEETPNQVPASYLLNEFNAWWINDKAHQFVRGVIKQDMTLLFSGRTFQGGTVGIAYVGGVCTATTNTGVIQLAQWDHSIYGKIVAHEAGHLLGISHDNALVDRDACGLDPNVIMWSNIPLEPGTTWTKCSAEAFKAHVEYGLARCLEDGGSSNSK